MVHIMLDHGPWLWKIWCTCPGDLNVSSSHHNTTSLAIAKTWIMDCWVCVERRDSCTSGGTTNWLKYEIQWYGDDNPHLARVGALANRSLCW